MPTYEYECAKCDKRFDVLQRMSDPPLKECPRCGDGPISRCVTAPTILSRASVKPIAYVLPSGRPHVDTSNPALDWSHPSGRVVLVPNKEPR